MLWFFACLGAKQKQFPGYRASAGKKEQGSGATIPLWETNAFDFGRNGAERRTRCMIRSVAGRLPRSPSRWKASLVRTASLVRGKRRLVIHSCFKVDEASVDGVMLGAIQSEATAHIYQINIRRNSIVLAHLHKVEGSAMVVEYFSLPCVDM